MRILPTVAMAVASFVAAVSAFTADQGKALVINKLHGLLQRKHQSGVVDFQTSCRQEQGRCVCAS